MKKCFEKREMISPLSISTFITAVAVAVSMTVKIFQNHYTVIRQSIAKNTLNWILDWKKASRKWDRYIFFVFFISCNGFRGNEPFFEMPKDASLSPSHKLPVFINVVQNIQCMLKSVVILLQRKVVKIVLYSLSVVLRLLARNSRSDHRSCRLDGRSMRWLL